MKIMRIKYYTSIFLIILLTVLPLFSEPVPEKPYVILISFDGFRWDYVTRGISPNLEYLAQEGVSASSLQPAFPTKTFPNHYTIVTGLYPENHGIIYNDFINPFTGEQFKVGDTSQIRNPKWYLGEALWETAERQGMTSASYFWPGSEIKLDYRRPTYVEYYDEARPYPERVQGVLAWLDLPAEKRPNFITLYFDATDTEGHKYGPDAPETNAAIQKLDSTLGLLIRGLRKREMLKSVNILVVSDHGMTAIDAKKIINIEQILSGHAMQIQGYGPVMMVNASDKELPVIYQLIKKHEKNFRVYRKSYLPVYYHFSHNPFIPPLILIADPGWSLVDNKISANLDAYLNGGNHGYDNHFMDMHGIFYAMGPAFKKGYRTGTLRNIDIYPLICKILKIEPNQEIDGILERIEFILQE
jgi:ectonucleotide pyrophosphatase/phosphodiesterase family protein 5